MLKNNFLPSIKGQLPLWADKAVFTVYVVTHISTIAVGGWRGGDRNITIIVMIMPQV